MSFCFLNLCSEFSLNGDQQKHSFIFKESGGCGVRPEGWGSRAETGGFAIFLLSQKCLWWLKCVCFFFKLVRALSLLKSQYIQSSTGIILSNAVKVQPNCWNEIFSRNIYIVCIHKIKLLLQHVINSHLKSIVLPHRKTRRWRGRWRKSREPARIWKRSWGGCWRAWMTPHGMRRIFEDLVCRFSTQSFENKTNTSTCKTATHTLHTLSWFSVCDWTGVHLLGVCLLW